MVAEQRLIAQLREDLGHSPVVSNVIFGFVLALVEKIVEVEFACPCNPRWNILFSAAFFVVPAFIAFMMMLLIHDCRSQNERTKRLYSVLPLFVWNVLLFLDGQYFVCAMTSWSGTFVSVDKTYLKWCSPANTTTYSSEKLMAYSKRMFVLSQGIGFGLLILLSVFLIGYVIMKCLKPRTTNASESENMELNPPHRSPPSRDDRDE